MRLWVEIRVSSGASRNICLREDMLDNEEIKKEQEWFANTLDTGKSFVVNEFVFNAKLVDWIRIYKAE